MLERLQVLLAKIHIRNNSYNKVGAKNKRVRLEKISRLLPVKRMALKCRHHTSPEKPCF